MGESGGRPWWVGVGPTDEPVTQDVVLRQALVDGWSARARSGQVAATRFGRLVVDLVTLGAPTELVRRTTEAQDDAVRHAGEALAVASRWAGRPVVAIVAPPERRRAGDLGAIARTLVAEGCIEGTIRAAQMRVAAGAVRDGTVRAGMLARADDEVRHADLAWALVGWALDESPSLCLTVEIAFAAHRFAPVVPGPDLARWGLPSPEADRRVALDVFTDVVRPCADALLALYTVTHA